MAIEIEILMCAFSYQRLCVLDDTTWVPDVMVDRIATIDFGVGEAIIVFRSEAIYLIF